MAAITATSMQGEGQRVVAVTTLSASDTFVYNPSARASLILNNNSGGALTPLIDGDESVSLSVKGLGIPVVTSGGFQMTSIADGASVSIPLDTISEYLKGVITLTGGDGIEAQILEY